MPVFALYFVQQKFNVATLKLKLPILQNGYKMFCSFQCFSSIEMEIAIHHFLDDICPIIDIYFSYFNIQTWAIYAYVSGTLDVVSAKKSDYYITDIMCQNLIVKSSES